jgi:hypothetical protein
MKSSKLKAQNLKLDISTQCSPTPNPHLPSPNNQGMATIFVLGLIAMLMVLGISFVDISILEKKASINYNNSVKSQISGEIALNRAIELIKLYTDNPTVNYRNIISYHNLNADENLAQYTDGLEKLSTKLNGIVYYDYDPDYSPVTWIYLKNDNCEINSRIAYVVIPDHGKIDPSATVDSGSNADTFSIISPSDGDDGIGANGNPDSLDREITMVDDNGKYVIGRPGRNINELFLRTLNTYLTSKTSSSLWFTNQNANNLSSVKIQEDLNGKLGIGKRWSDFSLMFESLGIESDSIRTEFRKTFYLNQPKSLEAYWIDENNDNLKPPSELYHRYNLARTDWDSFNNKVADSPLLNPSVSFSETDTEKINDAGIEWLKNWQSKGDFFDTERCQKQVTANLIDYSDTDIIATTDNENLPTYVGNEKCPYINEINIKFISNIQVKSNKKNPNSSYFAQVVPDLVSVESINMYDVTSGGINFVDLKATVKMDWEYTVAGKTYSRSDQSEMMINNADAFMITSRDSKFKNHRWLSTGWTNTTVQLNKIFIADLKIKKLTVKFENYDNSDFYDFSYIVDSDLVIDPKASTSAKNSYSYFNAQINDPRQNLLSTDWTLSYRDQDKNSLGVNNDRICTQNTISDSKDYEKTATKSWEISTAYIRNAPMKSPWELGFIHRGAIWQTINLKKFNSDQGVKNNAGGSEYSSGDANILNQIKMSNDTEVYGKININSGNIDVLKVLFQKIRVGSFEAANNSNKYPGWLTDDEIEAVAAEELANKLLELYEINAYKYFTSRAEILKDENDFAKLISGTDNSSLGLNQNSDAKQEEIIGKFINLTKASQGNLFVVIALGETIKDIGDVTINNIATEIGHFDLTADKVLSSQKIFAVIKKDPKTNKISILKFQYINE